MEREERRKEGHYRVGVMLMRSVNESTTSKVLLVELLGALTNQAVSSKPGHNQVLIYVVVACSTLAFSIPSTALVLRKKRPRIAKKMQKAAFLIGTFGFMGIMGMLLPSTITWCFTISAFLVFVLMFALASLIQ